MKVTLCARSKILQILGPSKVFRISATGSLDAGSHVDLVLDSEVTPFDSTISVTPRVVVDVQTATLLAGQTIDYDYNEDEFIISKRGIE